MPLRFPPFSEATLFGGTGASVGPVFDVSKHRIPSDPDWTNALSRTATLLQAAGGGTFYVPPNLPTPTMILPIIGVNAGNWLNNGFLKFSGIPLIIDIQTPLVDQQVYTADGVTGWGSYSTFIEATNCTPVRANIRGTSQIQVTVWHGGVTWLSLLDDCRNYDINMNVTGGFMTVRPAASAGSTTVVPKSGFMNIVANQLSYASIFPSNGGSETIANVHSNGCFRPYYIQGCHHLALYCESEDVQGDCIIGTSAATPPNEDIYIHHVDHSSPTKGGVRVINIQMSSLAIQTFRNIELVLDIESGQSGANGYGSTVTFQKTLADGVTPDTVGRGHIIDGFRIRGRAQTYNNAAYHAIDMIGQFNAPDDIRGLEIDMRMLGTGGPFFDAGSALNDDARLRIVSDNVIAMHNVGSSGKFVYLPGSRAPSLRPNKWGTDNAISDRISTLQPDKRQNLITNSSGITNTNGWSQSVPALFINGGGVFTATAVPVYSDTGHSLQFTGSVSTNGVAFNLGVLTLGVVYTATVYAIATNGVQYGMLLGQAVGGHFTAISSPGTGALQTNTLQYTGEGAVAYLCVRLVPNSAIQVNFEAQVEAAGTGSDLIVTDGATVTRRQYMSDELVPTGIRLRRYDGLIPTLTIAEGNNARMGTATLVGGAVTVPHTGVTATSRIFLNRSALGGAAGHLSYAITPGVSFTITSSSGTDTSAVNWLIVDPEV